MPLRTFQTGCTRLGRQVRSSSIETLKAPVTVDAGWLTTQGFLQRKGNDDENLGTNFGVILMGDVTYRRHGWKIECEN